ncbi:sodium:dicarboxylate symporter [Cladochytrium replicatum]|nr:sodium:dicarboxylate symporter [Cladochytrium replicatum]
MTKFSESPAWKAVTKVFQLIGKVHQLWWILILSIVGILCGLFASQFSKDYLKLLSTAIFLPMLKIVIFPIILSLLIVGIASHADEIERLGGLAVKSLVYFIVITIIAMCVGLIWANVFKPGHDLRLASYDPKDYYSKANGTSPVTLPTLLANTIPESIIVAGFNNKSLQLTFVGVMFGVAILLMPHPKERKILVGFSDAVVKATLKYVELVVRFVPIAIGGSLAATVASNGVKALVALGKLIGVVYLGLFTFVICVFLPIAIITRLPWRDFFKAWWKPVTIAFVTASSDAALGLVMENLLEFGVPADIIAWTLPIGYSFNLDGTTLYLGSAFLFVAQSAGIDLDAGTQIVYMFTLLLMSKGIAGLPRASLITLGAAVTQWGLPIEALSAILGVDEIMDMARTAVNVTGNMVRSLPNRSS